MLPAKSNQDLSTPAPIYWPLEQTDPFFLCPREQETFQESSTLILESKANLGW